MNGKRLKQARIAKGLTQRQLADELEVDPMAVSRWEREVCMPKIGRLAGIASALDVTVGYFWGNDDSSIIADIEAMMGEVKANSPNRPTEGQVMGLNGIWYKFINGEWAELKEA